MEYFKVGILLKHSKQSWGFVKEATPKYAINGIEYISIANTMNTAGDTSDACENSFEIAF